MRPVVVPAENFTDPNGEPYCADHSFTGTRWWWEDEAWRCERCEKEGAL